MTDKLITDLTAIGGALADNTSTEVMRNGQTASEQALGSDWKTYIKSWIAKADVGLSAVSNALQLTTANNLSDLANVDTARANLGLLLGMDPDFNDTGMYLTTPASNAVVSAGNMFANTLYMTPIWVPRTRTFTTYALAVTTGTATSTIRLGLYNANSAMQPTTKIDEIGTVVDGTTNALKTGAFGVSAALKPGMYFLAAVVNVTTPVVRMSPPTNPAILGSLMTVSGVTGNLGRSRALAYGALPLDETSQTYTSTANGGVSPPFVGIR